MDISKATVGDLLDELRGREEVVAVKCWTLKDLEDWVDNEAHASDDGNGGDCGVDRAKFIRENRDEIVGYGAGLLGDLEDCTDGDWQKVDSAMYDAVEAVMERTENDSKGPDKGTAGD